MPILPESAPATATPRAPAGDPRPQRILVVVDPTTAHGRGVIAGVLAYADGRPAAARRWCVDVAGWRRTAAGVDRGQVDGIIADGAGADLPDAVPLIGLAAGQRARHAVIADPATIGRVAAEHLLASGLRSYTTWGTPADTTAVFAASVAQAGARCLPGVDAAGAERDPAAWLAGLPLPIGVLAGDDRASRRLLDATRLLGLRVPEDVALLGIGDDESVCRASLPQLSSVRLPSERIGGSAAALLDRVLAGDAAAAEDRLPALGVAVRRSTQLHATGDAVVDRTLRFIAERFGDPIGVGDLLAAAAVSRRNLELRFRRLLHRTPAREILRLRLEHAKRLLAETDLRIGEVARRSGFTGLKHLGETFLREEGLSPGDYRRRLAPVAG